MVLLAFEAANNVRVSLRIGRVEEGERSRLRVIAEAWDLAKESTEALQSALVSAECTLGDRQTMEGAILRLLYALDFKLAETAWANENKTA